MPADQLTPDIHLPTSPDLATGAPSGWDQVNVEFVDWAAAAQIVQEHLRPVLPARRWWFVRKHPHWRLRHRPHDPNLLPRRLGHLTQAGVVRRWHTSTYEPETHAFGGPDAVDLAHELFCRDSPTALTLTQPRTTLAGGRRAEVSVLAITRMLRAAALEPYEQGDVWALAADLRHGAAPDRPGPNPLDSAAAAGAARRLVTLDTSPSSPLLLDGPLTPLRDWLDAFTAAGHQLAQLAHTGRLHRGLRAVLAYHLLFHWNRLALPAAHQDTLAQLVRDIFIPHDVPDRTVTDRTPSPR